MAMKLALVDGYNLAFRAFYGMPELRRADGFPTGALHGWVRSLWAVEDQLKPDRLVVAFDLGGAARQTALHADYKANRADTPADLERQIPALKRWVRACGHGPVEKEGIEADDLIAALARTQARAGHEVWVVSADKDFAQLIAPGIFQLLPPPTANPRLGWRPLDRAAVEAKFGVPPECIAALLALVGDTADNIPGLRGVGPKTAAQWLRRYGNLEAIIANCGELQPRRFQALVHAGRDDLRRNLAMTTLDDAHELPLEDLPPADPAAAIALLEEMDMPGTVNSLRRRTGRLG
jgi:DNA polymerase-1